MLVLEMRELCARRNFRGGIYLENLNVSFIDIETSQDFFRFRQIFCRCFVDREVRNFNKMVSVFSDIC